MTDTQTAAASDDTPAPDEQRVADISANLRASAVTLRSALVRLNTRSRPCSCCGRKEFENFLEANAHEAIEGMVAKLTRWADALEHPERSTTRGFNREDVSEMHEIRRRSNRRNHSPHRRG